MRHLARRSLATARPARRRHARLRRAARSRSARATAWSSRRTPRAARSARRCWRRAAPRSTRRWRPRSRWRSRTRRPATSAAAASCCIGPRRASRSPTTSARSAPAGATPTMFLQGRRLRRATAPRQPPGGRRARHRRRPAPRLEGARHAAVEAAASTPAIALARDGFVVTRRALARSLEGVLPEMKQYPASSPQFTKDGAPYEPGDAAEAARPRADARSASRTTGPAGFYEGETAAAHREGDEGERRAHHARRPHGLPGASGARRCAARYRGYDVLAMPPISSGGTALLQMLNMLEGYDLKAARLRLRRRPST